MAPQVHLLYSPHKWFDVAVSGIKLLRLALADEL
jgi:hypothetical protein